MDKKPNWSERFKIKWALGVPLAPSVDLGRCDEVWIRYENVYLSLLISAEGENKGEIASIGWADTLPERVLVREVKTVK